MTAKIQSRHFVGPTDMFAYTSQLAGVRGGGAGPRRPYWRMSTESTPGSLVGTLIGTAIGDALGLPSEGLSAERIARRFPRLDRYGLLGPMGFVSDDTEQSALVAQSLLRHPQSPESCARDFRRSLVGWLLRVPFGAGLATVRAGIRAGCGIAHSGVLSAGNGAAMRASVLGAYFPDQPERRREFGLALSRVTHVDPRAVEGALFVADVAARCALLQRPPTAAELGPDLDRVGQQELRAALHLATNPNGRTMPTSGYVVHSVPWALRCLLAFPDDPMSALQACIRAGGDTDSNAAILGGWLGAAHGEQVWPFDLVENLCRGPFGRDHLRSLGTALAKQRLGEPVRIPGYSWPSAMARNLVLLPVILAHGFRRLLP